MKEYTFLETNHWIVNLSEKDQRYLGRSYVTLKRPCTSLSELTEEEGIDFFHLIKKFEDLMKQKFGAIMFNWTCLMNNAYQEHDSDPQVHWHVRPRYDKEVIIGGETFTDPNFGYHYNREPEKNREVSKDVMDAIYHQLIGS